MACTSSVPRIESLSVRNYRALRSVELRDLSPLTVLLGPNGSGKSTVFDVFAFLAESFESGLRTAWERRNRFRELRTRGCEGPIVFEIKYRESAGEPVITYHLEIDEQGRAPVVSREWLQWRRGARGKPFRFLDFSQGQGNVVSGDTPDDEAQRQQEVLSGPELLAVSTLGQFAKHPRVSALRSFISGWYLSYISAASTRSIPESGPQERLSATGDNLPNVIQYLDEQHPDRLAEILRVLSRRVPRLERVIARVLDDGRLMMQIKDAPFKEPILAKFASDGTLKMLAYLTILYDPVPAPFIGVEEPENQLFPFLMHGLAEECRLAADRSQVLVTTHSPQFVSALRPRELRLLQRDDRGFTHATSAAALPDVERHVESGATLGDLWLESYLTTPTEMTSADARP
jgi:predicted ATPase